MRELVRGYTRLLACPSFPRFVHLFQDLNAKPLAKRLKLWRFRKELLRQNSVASQLSHSPASGETAAAPPPVIKQETERKRKFEESPFGDPLAQLHEDKKKSNFRFIEFPDGSAPFMSSLHVAFAAKSVELLRKRNTLTGTQLIELWNEDLQNDSITVESAPPGRGHKATGKADTFFNNGYFKMPQLHKMARGELPLPIPNTGAASGADGAHANVRRREGARGQARAPAAAGADDRRLHRGARGQITRT